MTKEIKTAPEKSTTNSSRIIIVIAAIVAVLALVGMLLLNNMDDSSDSSVGRAEEEAINANCSATECLAQINVNNSIEEITAVTGVDPEVDETSGTAKWKLSQKESIAREKSGSGYILQATINKGAVASDNVDFSIFSDLKKELESGETFTYDELVKRLGSVEGVLAGKTSTSKRYIWVDKHDQTFSATFSDKDGTCSIISLR